MGLLEAEARSKDKVAVTVVETVLDTLVPVPLVVGRQGIEEVAGSAHECHLGGQIGRQEPFFTLDGIGEAVAVANAGRKSDVVQPAMMEYPTIAIANQHTEVTVPETVVGCRVGQKRLEFRAQGAHIHHHVLVAQINAREQ